MNKTNFAPPFNNQDYANGFREGQNHSVPSAETVRRLETIENTIIDFPAFMQYVKDMLAEIKGDTSYTNGKVAEVIKWQTEIIKWQSEIKGAKKALWGVWGFVGIFIIAGVFTLFSMWSQVQHINDQLDNMEQK